MKIIKNLIDKTKPQFEKGGKYEKWLPVYESFETFFFVPKKVTSTGAHIRDAIDMKRSMILVVVSLLPALLFGMWNVGELYYMSIGETTSILESFWQGFLQVLPLIVVSYGVGLGLEFVFVYIRGHEINEGFLVTGMLIPLIVPVDIPLWMLAVATAFSVLIGKEAFGGTGMNIVNPALLTRAFLFFAYPAKMSGNTVWIKDIGQNPQLVDGFTGETILGQKVNMVTEAYSGFVNNKLSMLDMFIGNYAGSVGETSTIAILIGAAILLYTGIASYRIMISVFAGGYLMGLLLNAVAPEGNVLLSTPALEHLLIGGFAFGAVFMATDPVTASQTNRGKWIYGFLIGVFAILIRTVNPAYPEGMMLAILFMNVFAPLIDHYIVQANIKARLRRAKINMIQSDSENN
ncbi:MAG: NADH:ubiquinone reductase (Na(+)-transporting) subunit B [Bacteroidales bacterium]|jgi:Na+-transporting NADH:ubiquinone oxidoreductase subunit B|nr:NADH:ubiquinone reductase (Na(+)-transporting) subunit B [Bacteroidales bacterium]